MNENKNDDEKTVEWIDSERLVEGFFTVDKIRLRHTMYSGEMSPPLVRFLLRRPDAVCAVVVNTESNSMYFVRQFRLGPAAKGDPAWMVELTAGLVDEGETPLQAILREIKEELGFMVATAQEVTMLYPSSAIISERIFLYYVEVNNAQRVSDGGGNPHEHEDLEIIEVPLPMVESFMREERLTDAKTLIGLRWYLAGKAGS